jgi:serine/threonine protein kinase
LTIKAENKIIKGFEAIHALGVVHGDIRADNILVGEGGNAVWIVDFEFSALVGEGHDVKPSKTAQEMAEVKRILKDIKNYRNRLNLSK